MIILTVVYFLSMLICLAWIGLSVSRINNSKVSAFSDIVSFLPVVAGFFLFPVINTFIALLVIWYEIDKEWFNAK